MTSSTGHPEPWQLVRFAEIAESINERVDDPPSSGLEYYVGLEHLDPDSLKIRRWGSPSDVDSTKLSFDRGDVIYARRRAYQRKLGVAEWSGIASAHALVLRARPDVCLPQFLPYFLQSDQFHGRALDISVGSLSPTINWKTLAAQEFELPSVDVQSSVVAILATLDEAIERLRRARSAASLVRHALVSHESGTRERPLGTVLTACDYGMSAAAGDSGEVPMLRMNNLNGEELTLEDLKWIDAAAVRDQDLLTVGDILFNRTNSLEHVGKLALVDELEQPMTFASYLLRLRVSRDVAVPEFIAAYLQSPAGQRQVEAYVTQGVSQANINGTNLRKVLVPLPPLPVQRSVAERWNEVRSLQASLDDHIARALQLRGALREQLISRETSSV